jgi:hypothetical protein
MPIFEVEAPDGKILEIEGPEGATEEQVLQFASQQYQAMQRPQVQEDPTGGVVESLVGGAKRLGSQALTGIKAPFIGAEEAAVEGMQREQQIEERPATSLEEVKRIYEEEGLFPAAKEAISQIPAAVAEQSPFLLSIYGGFKAGAALPGTPQTKAITGIIGAMAAPFLVQSGGNIQRQVEEQIQAGEDPDVSLTKAYGTAALQASLDVGSLYFGLGRAFGIAPKKMGTEAAEKIAKESTLKAITKGTAQTALAEIPTEIAQQMLERSQAGLDLLSEDAMKEYAEVGFAAGLISPLGGVARPFGARNNAREYLAEKERIAQEELDRRNKIELAKIEKLKIEEAEKERILAEEQAKIDAQNKRIRQQIYADPGKSVQDIIDEVTGVKPKATKKEIEERKKDIEKELNQKVNIFINDPITQQERQLTLGELQRITNPELFEAEPTLFNVTKIDKDFAKMIGVAPNAGFLKDIQGLEITSENANDILAGLNTYKGSNQKVIGNIVEFLNRPEFTEQITPQEVQDELTRAEGIPEPGTDTGSVGLPSEARVTPSPDAEAIAETGRGGLEADIRAPSGPTGRGRGVDTALESKRAQDALLEESPEETWSNLSDTAFADLTPEVKKQVIEAKQDGFLSQEVADRLTLTDRNNKIAERQQGMSKPEEDIDDIQEARAETIPDSGETAQSINQALTQEFGENVNTAQSRGKLRIVNTVNELPENIRRKVAPNATGAFSGGTSYIIANRVSKTNARSTLLHEIGEHYGLSTMLGEGNYNSALNRLKTLKDTDRIVAQAWRETKRLYPELSEGSKPYLQEVMAKVAERAPNNTLITRLRGLLKNFLTKLGLYNPDTFTTKDLQDLLLHSLRTSLAKDVVASKKTQQAKKDVVSEEDIAIANATSRSSGAVGEKAVVPRVVASMVDKAQSILDFGAGKDAMHTQRLRGEGFDVTAYEFGSNINPALHDANALNRDYDVVYASNVLNTQNSDAMLEATIEQINSALKEGGTAIVNLPGSPRKGAYSGLSQREGANLLKQKLEEIIGPVERVEGSASQPVFRVTKEGPIQYMKVPAEFSDTAVYAAPETNSETFRGQFVQKFDKFKSNPKGSLQENFVKGRIQIVDSTSGLQEKLIKDFNNAVEIDGKIRADIALDQAREGNILGAQSAEEGFVKVYRDGRSEVIVDENNIKNMLDLRNELAKEVGPDGAKHLVQSYLLALRYQSILQQNARNQQRADQARANGNIEAAKRYEKNIKEVTKEQADAVQPGLAYANKYPILRDIATMLENININRIDMMEEAGLYSKQQADEYRANPTYVPLFRLMDDLADGSSEVRQFFNSFSNLGREYEFKGSERQVDDVISNILKQHFWSVNAAVRNNANRAAANMVGVRNPDTNELELYDTKPSGIPENHLAPVHIDGQRKFVNYTDPNIAIAIQGSPPAFSAIVESLGSASKLFRLGITANPIFQTYQVFNDAIGAAMFSGVNKPFQLMGRVIGGFFKDQGGSQTKAINDQMARLGIAGGYGRTFKDIFEKAERELGVANSTKIQQLMDKVDEFASKSDLAQRRGIFEQTLLETGGVKQSDGSIKGGNEILAMNRALNIINWQKRGASGFVRNLTHMVPFLNAYIQGTDVMFNAMRGKGIAGKDVRAAQFLFLKTGATLMALNYVYAMMVSGDDEYESQDDRTKFRNYMIPGTGFKMPVRAELSLLLKYIPEQTMNILSKEGTANEVDRTKLLSSFRQAVGDALLGPNLFPQLVRGTVEVMTNYDFYNGRPLVGIGLSRLATKEQYTEGSSEFAKLLGQTGVISPINADHLVTAYTGTVGATALYILDEMANLFMDTKRPDVPLTRMPLIRPLFYREEGRGQLNDFYDLRQRSEKVTGTFNHYLKFQPEKAREYQQDNQKMLAVRSQVNAINNQLTKIREVRKAILNSNMPGDEKRKRLDAIDKQANNLVRNVQRVRIAAGL